MSVQMAAFAFGCFLLMVALVGGGFQVKEIKVPRVGRIPRLTSCAFSLLFLFVGVRPDFVGGGPAPAAPEPLAAAPTIQVVERVVERPVLLPAPAPAQQVLPAAEAPSHEARPAAAPKEKKPVPWEQKPRQWWNRIRG